jgi:hypothetical protein
MTTINRLNLNKLIILFMVLALMLGANNALAKSENANSSQGQGGVVVGNVQEVKNDKITVEDKKGQGKKEATLNGQEQIIKQDNQGSSVNKGKGNILSNIKKLDKVALITEDATKSGKGKVVKIFVKDATASAQSKRRAVQGVITEINGLTLTIAHQIHRERISSVSANAATVIKMKDTEGASFSSLQVGQRVVAVGDLVGSGGILAKRIHVIPGKATGIFNRLPVATTSASPVATSSASPAASITPEPTVSPEPTP